MTGHSQQGSLIDRFRVKAVVDQLISTHSHLSSSPSTTVGGSQRFADANAVASLHIRAQHCIVTGPMNLPVPVDQNKLTGFQSRVTRRPLLLWCYELLWIPETRLYHHHHHHHHGGKSVRRSRDHVSLFAQGSTFDVPSISSAFMMSNFVLFIFNTDQM